MAKNHTCTTVNYIIGGLWNRPGKRKQAGPWNRRPCLLLAGWILIGSFHVLAEKNSTVPPRFKTRI